MTIKVYQSFVFLLLNTFVLRAQMIDEKIKNNLFAPPQTFLFTTTTLNPLVRQWSLNYSGGYGQNTVAPVGFNGIDQNITLFGYLGNSTTLLTSVGVGFANSGHWQTTQQAEILRDFIGGNNPTGFRLGTSLGLRREFGNDIIALSRLTATYEGLGWKIGANARFEKAFSASRDELDVITSFGIQRRINKQLFAGVEAVGQDLEGLWQTDEAEGGARILIGPSLNFVPSGSPLSFSVCGGPILQITRSAIIANDSVVRDLPLTNSGFTMKFNVGFRFL